MVITSEGKEYLLEAVKQARGGIFIISHIGNYEVAANALGDLGFKHMIMMGEREAKQVARQQRESLMRKKIVIHVSSARQASPLDGLEAIKFLKDGGFVSVAGDIAWTDPHARVAVELFGCLVHVPSAPYLLAMASGAPILILFTFRLGRGKHKIVLTPLQIDRASSRSDRKSAIQARAQEYAKALEKAVYSHPFQWYVFEPIFGVKQN
jgi:lauroyl/myristoyl acyltransferase